MYHDQPLHQSLRFAIAAVIALANSDAFAQHTIEEITVSARRKVEIARDVPIPLSVIGGGTLDAKGAFNVARLAELQPSLQLYSSNPRNTAVNIRGLGAPFGLTNDGIEPGVGVYVDQVYNARPASTTFDFIDVAQVEVLRGPQGTLYGKNTTAGAINVTTRAPSFTPAGRLETSVGDWGFQQTRGYLTGPLSERIAARLSFSGTQREGTLRHGRTGARVNDLNNLGVRSQILFDVTDALSVTLQADYNQQRAVCCTQVFASVASTQRPLNRQYAQMAADLGYTPPSTNPFDRLTDIDSPLQVHQDLGGMGLVAEWNGGPGTLTSVTAYRYWHWYPSNDRDFTALPITTVSANPSKQQQWTQEFRYAATVNERLDYVVGLFLYKQTIHSQGLQAQGSAAARWLLAPAVNASTVGLLDGLQQANDIHFTNNSYALFSQLTWSLTEHLSLVPGLRLNYDAKATEFNSVVSGGLETNNAALIAPKNSVLQSQSYQAPSSDADLSGQLTLAYALGDNVNVYATYSQSFKSVGVNLSGIPNDAAGNPALAAATVKPEKVQHYELGVKSTLLEGLLTANFNAFTTKINDYQANVVNASVGVLRGYLANAKQVTVHGAEIELGYSPTDSLNVTLNATLSDGKYADFADAPCPLELTGAPAGPLGAGVCDISGTALPGLSDTALSASAEYTRSANLFGLSGEAFVGIDTSYRSAFSSSATASRYLVVDEYTLSNFRVGFRADKQWELFAWTRNAFNTEYFESLSAQPGNSGLIVAQVGDPRTAGVTVNVSF
jgi:iron complex outermembrane recepter protein